MKRTKLTIVLCFFAALLTACGDKLTPTEEPLKGPMTSHIGRYRGKVKVTTILSERLLQSGEFFALDHYLGNYQLTDLLGVQIGIGLESSFQNGQPNSVNLLVWYLTLRSLAQDTTRFCTNPPAEGLEVKYKADFLQSLRQLCQWPSAEAQNEEVMFRFWTYLLWYDAPVEEFHQWRNFFLENPTLHKSANDAVSDMIFAALYNPYFLLEQ